MGCSPTLLSIFTLLTGPKHSTSRSSSSGSAVAFSVDEKEVAFDVPGLAVKALFCPQALVFVDICDTIHSSVVLFTLQRMTAFMPLMSVTVQSNVNALPGHVGDLGGVNCPST